MYDHLYVGVKNIKESLTLWRDVLGFSVSIKQAKDCRTLESLWALEPSSISGLALLATPRAPCGKVMLVEFVDECESVRDGAQAFDLCPKNLDINVVNFHDRVAELKAAGFELRSEPVFYAIENLEVWEVQVVGCDGVNLVLAEIVGETPALTDRLFGGITSVVTTVADIEKEMKFYNHLGFSTLDSHHLKGEEIEKMIGLPKGASLHMQLLGNQEHRFGRAELVKYEKVTGNNLYPRANPPAIGFFRAAVVVDNLEACVTELPENAVISKSTLKIDYLDRQFITRTVISPSGFHIDLLQNA